LATRLPGCPAARLPGCPAARLPGCPAARLPGCPAARQPGNPATRQPGNPATRQPGNPATRQPGNPATRHSPKKFNQECDEASKTYSALVALSNKAQCQGHFERLNSRMMAGDSPAIIRGRGADRPREGNTPRPPVYLRLDGLLVSG